MNIFAYGSLMFDDVWKRVVRGVYRHEPATLHGYLRRAVIGETYPVVVASRPESTVAGRLYQAVSTGDVERLDVFEGNYYRRCSETVRLPDGRLIEAGFYVLRDAYTHIMADQDWDPDHFRRDGVHRFLASYLGFSDNRR